MYGRASTPKQVKKKNIKNFGNIYAGNFVEVAGQQTRQNVCQNVEGNLRNISSETLISWNYWINFKGGPVEKYSVLLQKSKNL